MKKNVFILFLLTISIANYAQEIQWGEITASYNLPEGITLYKGSRTSPILEIYYVDIDLNNPSLAVRPYITNSTDKVTDLVERFGAYLAVNGGYFGGSTSYSAVVYPGEVKATNIGALSRNGNTYPVIRSAFSVRKDGTPSVDWIYHFGNTVEDIYRFDNPLPYTSNDQNPEPVPSQNDGTLYEDIFVAIGGGPVLIKNGEKNVTYNEEIFWGSGISGETRQPRTAVGYTADNHVIMLVADGRQTISNGVTIDELADIMLQIGCVEAMNLDGGGSTQMGLEDSYINSPSEYRSVPTILAVVHADSLKMPKQPVIERIVDTGDEEATEYGTGWMESANAGYWAETPSIIKPLGDGSSYYEFEVHLPKTAVYEVQAWWVAASNRCSDAPYIVNHQFGADTVRLDQTVQGTWNTIGSYILSNQSTENVILSDNGTQGSYVVADAIRFVCYDTTQVDKLIANNDFGTTYEIYPVNIELKGNDYTFGLSDVHTEIVKQPEHGTVQMINPWLVTYIPEADFIGNDTIDYNLYYGEEKALSDTAHIIVDVQSTPPPTVLNDYCITDKNTEVNYVVLNNDDNHDLSSLTALILDQPKHGTATLEANYSITYIPDTDFAGNDTLSYAACYSHLTSVCETGEMIIEVQGNQAIADFNFSNNMKIYPNPAKENVVISLQTKRARNIDIEVIDITGRILLSEKRNAGTGSVQIPLLLDNISKGCYFIKVQVDDNKIVRKFMKQ